MIGAPVLAPAARCRFCGKWRHPREFVHDSIVGMCWQCAEWHKHALDLFAGAGTPRGCQDCGIGYEALEAISPAGNVRFAFHAKDGVYQILGVACGCDADYQRKRLDLYGNTPHGARAKLAGAK